MEKPQLNVVVMGHSECGKSTIIGHLLVNCAGVKDELVKEAAKEADIAGHTDLRYAWILEKIHADKEKGAEIRRPSMETNNFIYTFIDVPGHRDFIRHIVDGTSQADVAILVVSAAEGEFEVGFAKDGQTREHLMIAFALGIKQLIVCINKIDLIEPHRFQTRYNNIIKAIKGFSQMKIGFNVQAIPIVPVSGWTGDNLTEKSEAIPWYRGWEINQPDMTVSTGWSLLDAMDAFSPPTRAIEMPLRIPITSSYSNSDGDVIASGKIESGILTNGMDVVLRPGGVHSQVSSIKRHTETVEKASAGDYVTFNVGDVPDVGVRPGVICGSECQDPPVTCKELTCQIIILDYQGKITRGFTPIIDIHTAHVMCRLQDIKIKVDRTTGENAERSPEYIEKNDAAIVTLVPIKPLVAETFKDYPSLGRFSIRDSRRTIGVGVVKSVVKKGLKEATMIDPDLFRLSKHQLNIVVVGHVDAGKSTTVGHLLVKCGAVEQSVVQKAEEDAKRTGHDSFRYSWILDKLKIEREKHMSVDIKRRTFETTKCKFNLIDAPGHRDYVKNMLNGTTQADAALLLISAAPGECEVGFGKGGQTREHLILAYALGVKQIIVAINKMDKTEPPYSKDRFEQIVENVIQFIKLKVGFHLDSIAFVPICALDGDNLTEPLDTAPWYKGWNTKRMDKSTAKGMTLLDAMDSLMPQPRHPNKPLRVPVMDIFKIGDPSGNQVVVVNGRILTGSMKTGMPVMFSPGNVKSAVNGIEINSKKVDEAVPGEYVGFDVGPVPNGRLKRGCVCGDAENDPPKECDSLTAQVIILDHPGQIKKGYTPVIDIHTAHVACKFNDIKIKLDRKTGRKLEHNPDYLQRNDAAIVELLPSQPLVVENFSNFAALGRFSIRDMKNTVGIGIVKSVEKKSVTADSVEVCQAFTSNESKQGRDAIDGAIGETHGDDETPQVKEEKSKKTESGSLFQPRSKVTAQNRTSTPKSVSKASVKVTTKPATTNKPATSTAKPPAKNNTSTPKPSAATPKPTTPKPSTPVQPRTTKTPGVTTPKPPATPTRNITPKLTDGVKTEAADITPVNS